MEKGPEEGSTAAAAGGGATGPTSNVAVVGSGGGGGAVVTVESSFFKDISYCIFGNIDPQLLKLLETGGGKRTNFAGVGTTHVFAGEGADKLKIEEAQEVFEVPVVSPLWIFVCASLKKILPLDGFNAGGNLLFSNVCVSTSGIRKTDKSSIWAMTTFHGGKYIQKLTKECTHLITISPNPTSKYQEARKLGLKIVTPDWVYQCVSTNTIAEERMFDPELLIIPTSKEPQNEEVLVKVEIKPPPPPAANTLIPATQAIKLSETPNATSPTKAAPATSNILQNKLMSQQQQQVRAKAPTDVGVNQVRMVQVNQTRLQQPVLTPTMQQQLQNAATKSSPGNIQSIRLNHSVNDTQNLTDGQRYMQWQQKQGAQNVPQPQLQNVQGQQQIIRNPSPAPIGSQLNAQNQQVVPGPQQQPQPTQTQTQQQQQQMIQGQSQQASHQIQQHNQPQLHTQGNAQQVQMQGSHQIHPNQMSNQQQGNQQQQQLRQMNQMQQSQTFQTMGQMQPPGHIPSQHAQQHQNQQQLQNVQQMHSPQHLQSSQKLQSPQQMQSPGHQQMQSPGHQQMQSPVHQQMQSPVHQHIQSPVHQQILSPSPQQLQNQMSQQMQGQVPQQIQSHQMQNQTQHMQGQVSQQLQGQVPQQMQGQVPQQIQNQVGQMQGQLSQQQMQGQLPQQMQTQIPQQMQGHVPQQLQGQIPHQMQQGQGQQIQGQVPQQIQMQGQVPQHMQNQGGQMSQPMQGQVGQMSQQMQLQVGQMPQQMHGQTGQLSQQLHGQSGQLQGQVGQMPQQLQNQIPQQIQGQVNQIPQQMQGQIPQQLQNQLSQSMQNQIPQQMQAQQHQGQQQLQSQGPQQVQTNQQNQFQQGQLQFQNQNMQQIQFQNQNPVRAQQQRQFNPGQVQSQQQIRVVPVSTQNQQIHFQVVHQQPNRQPMMINQGTPRGQYQQQGNVTSPNNPMNQQQVYRQQQPNQIQLFHPIQQGHRMQSPDQQHPGNQIQSNPNQLQQNQGQLHQIPGHYNVVINQFSPNSPNTHQQVNSVNSTQMGQTQQPLSQGQSVQYARPSPWTAQHSDIVRQAHSDPEFAAKWNNMDPEQRTLFLQQLMQTRKNESMRQEMMQRQQQMQQQSGNASQPQAIGVGQSPQRPVLGSPQTVMGSSNQNLSLQQNMQTHVVGQTHVDKQLNHLPPNSPASGQVGLVGNGQQTQGPVGSQPQQMLLQGHQLQKTPPGISSVQGGVQVQNSPNQQTVLGSQPSPGATQKFLPPQIQTRMAPHGYIGSQQGSPQVVGVVRTQIYTPQVGQQQQRVNIRHGMPQQQPPGQQPRQHLVVQHPGGPGGPTKMAIMSPGQQQQQQGHLPQQPNSLHWSPNQRMTSPNQPGQFQNRLQSPEQMNTSSQQSSWNVRPPNQSPLSPSGSQSTMSYVVNSKTKTALANLLSNRLQGNAVPESNAVPTTSASTPTTSVLSSTATTQAMCPPPPPPVTSQSLSQPAPVTAQTNVVLERRTLANITNGSKTIQVNTFGSPRAQPASQVASSPTTPPRPQFYGHDPQLTIPQDKHLLGCVFWQAENNLRVDSLSGIISRHGGEFVKEYNSTTVTHVICETQAFNEFVQVMRDGKRVVTLHWLNDICNRKMLLPPYYAIHLPVPFKPKGESSESKRNVPEPPLKDHVFSTTGFASEDRQRLVQMLKLLGAEYTGHFSSLNTGLVAFRAEGMKYQKAREWKRPVVSLQLLNELMLGHYSGLQMMHSPKYQNFTVDQPFRFDINLALGLMAPWKTPIRPTAEQKLKRRSDGDEESTSPKVIVIDIDDEVISPQGVDTEQNNCDLDQEAELSIWKPIVLLSGFTRRTKENIKHKIEILGGKVTIDYKEATHLLIKANMYTMKLFYAICRMRHIVGISWITASIAAKKFVDERAHVAIHKPFEEAYQVKLADLMQKPSRRTLFKDLTFHITPGLTGVRKQDLFNLIECAGGTALTVRNWKVRDMLSKYPKKNILVTCPQDFNICQQHLSKARRPHLINVCYEEDIWNWVAAQRICHRNDGIPNHKKSTSLAVVSESGSDSKIAENCGGEKGSTKESVPSIINGCSFNDPKPLTPFTALSSPVRRPSNTNIIGDSPITTSPQPLSGNNISATKNSVLPNESAGASTLGGTNETTTLSTAGCEEPMDIEDETSLS